MRSPNDHSNSGSSGSRLAVLIVGAIGVVYGDIGTMVGAALFYGDGIITPTSPLYTMREAFGLGGLPLGEATVLGVLSLVFWALLVVVTIKYVAVIMRADNQGHGGVLALARLALRGLRAGGRRQQLAIVLAAISVLSAVEGLQVATPAFEPYVVPLAGGVGKLFGPMMCIWFATLGLLGLWQILADPSVLRALSPIHAAESLSE